MSRHVSMCALLAAIVHAPAAALAQQQISTTGRASPFPHWSFWLLLSIVAMVALALFLVPNRRLPGGRRF